MKKRQVNFSEDIDSDQQKSHFNALIEEAFASGQPSPLTKADIDDARHLVKERIRKRQKQKLEALLLEGTNSELTPFTKADFESIKECGLERIRQRRKK